MFFSVRLQSFPDTKLKSAGVLSHPSGKNKNAARIGHPRTVMCTELDHFAPPVAEGMGRMGGRAVPCG